MFFFRMTKTVQHYGLNASMNRKKISFRFVVVEIA